MATRNTPEDRRLRRLIDVAEMMLMGKTQHQIALVLKISESTASRDVRTVREKWAMEAQDTVAELVAKESQRLEFVIERLMPKVAGGMYGAIDRLLRVIELKMKLYGVDSKNFAENMRELLAGKADSLDDLGTVADAIRELQGVFDKRGKPEDGTPAQKAVSKRVLN